MADKSYWCWIKDEWIDQYNAKVCAMLLPTLILFMLFVDYLNFTYFSFLCVVSSFQEKLTTMEAENQLLRQQALLRTPVRTIPENRSPKYVCAPFTGRNLWAFSFWCHVQMFLCCCFWLRFCAMSANFTCWYFKLYFFKAEMFVLFLPLQNYTNGSPLSEEQKVRNLLYNKVNYYVCFVLLFQYII